MLKEKLEELKDQLHWKIKQELFDSSNKLRDVSTILRVFNLNYSNITENNLIETVLKLDNYFRLEEKGFILDGEKKNTIQLDNGNYLYFDFGKYRPNITFILPNLDNKIKFKEDKLLIQQLNLLYSGGIKFIKGRFFISKKGKPMFDLTGNTPHILCQISWGGAFNKSQGLEDVPEDKLYYRCARSNGGGQGNDYLVVPVDYSRKFNLDDF